MPQLIPDSVAGGNKECHYSPLVGMLVQAPWMGCQFEFKLSPAFLQASMTVLRWPFILLDEERNWVRVKCFAQKHNSLIRASIDVIREGCSAALYFIF